jgi:holo-[acyl-carrier protein] synthase
MIQGLGIELVAIDAFESLAEASRQEELARRFTSREIEYCLGKRRAGEHLAARHAAKVAVLKALGLALDGDEQLRAIEVVRAVTGQPRIELAEPLRSEVEALGISHLHLSLSHSGGYAVGMVVAERRSITRQEDEG